MSSGISNNNGKSNVPYDGTSQMPVFDRQMANTLSNVTPGELYKILNSYSDGELEKIRAVFQQGLEISKSLQNSRTCDIKEPFTLLSTDLKVLIFSYLSGKEMMVASMVSKDWYRIFTFLPSLFQGICLGNQYATKHFIDSSKKNDFQNEKWKELYLQNHVFNKNLSDAKKPIGQKMQLKFILSEKEGVELNIRTSYVHKQSLYTVEGTTLFGWNLATGKLTLEFDLKTATNYKPVSDYCGFFALWADDSHVVVGADHQIIYVPITETSVSGLSIMVNPDKHITMMIGDANYLYVYMEANSPIPDEEDEGEGEEEGHEGERIGNVNNSYVFVNSSSSAVEEEDEGEEEEDSVDELIKIQRGANWQQIFSIPFDGDYANCMVLYKNWIICGLDEMYDESSASFIQFFNAETGTSIPPFFTEQNPINSLQICENYLVYTAKNNVYVLDLETKLTVASKERIIDEGAHYMNSLISNNLLFSIVRDEHEKQKPGLEIYDFHSQKELGIFKFKSNVSYFANYTPPYEQTCMQTLVVGNQTELKLYEPIVPKIEPLGDSKSQKKEDKKAS